MLGYYVVPVKAVNVWWKRGRGKKASREERRCESVPKYAIVDTGSNMLSVGAPLLRELRDRGISTLSPRRRLRIVLGEGGAGSASELVLDYSHREYCMGGELLVRDNLPFSKRDSVLLLGTLFMRNRYVEFDLENKTLGMTRLKGAVPCPASGCPAAVMRTVRPTS